MIFVVFAGLTIIPSMILWRTGNRYLRGTAVGLAGAFLSVLVLLAWRPWATMSDEEVDRAKAEVLASGHADVYLGDAVARYPLNAYYLDGGEANSYYGTCHPSADYAEGGCTAWDMSIHNTWRDVTIGGDAIAGCIRQERSGEPERFDRWARRKPRSPCRLPQPRINAYVQQHCLPAR